MTKKISDLDEETVPILTDLLEMVDDPGGTPVSKKVQIGNLPSGGIWEQIASYNASVDVGTITLNFTTVDFDNDSQIMVVMDGEVNQASALLMRVNGITTSYNEDGQKIIAGVETLIDINNASQHELIADDILASASDHFHCIAHLSVANAGLNDPMIMSAIGYGLTRGQQVVSGERGGVTTISSITIFLSTGTWDAQTRFTVYKLSRT